MRCPHCGATVKVRGSRWECGFCGDCGVLSTPQVKRTVEEPSTITLSFSLTYEVDLLETWNELKDTLQNALAEQAAPLISELGATVIYEICHALSDPRRRLPDEKKEKLAQFLTYTPDLGPVPSVSTLVTASSLPISQQEVAVYQSIGQLSESVCGTFWTKLIQHLLSEDDLNQINDMFVSFSQIYQYFVTDEWDGECFDRKNELQEAFESHWYHNRYFAPNIDPAIRRLRSEDDSQLDDDCRDILVAKFPEYFQTFRLDELVDLEWSTLISDLLDYDRPLGLAMWQVLLDHSQPGWLEEQYGAGDILAQL